MKIQSFYTVPAICLYYEDNSELFYQIADDQDPALLELAKRAELENDCELPAGIVVVWAGETVAFRVAGSTNETEVGGCFMGMGLIVLARYLDETGQQCVMELTESENAEHIEQLVAALNALTEPAPAQDGLLPCPFCGNALEVSRRRYNPHARCVTENCKGAQLPLLNIDQPDDVARWNTRPAQTEQQPCGYQYQTPDGDWFPIAKSMIAEAEEHGHKVRSVYAAPIAQTVTQDTRAISMLVAEAAFKAGNGHDRSVGSDTLREIVNSVFEQLGMQTAPQPEQGGLRAGRVVAMCEVGHDRLERAALDTKRLEWMLAERCIIESQNGTGSPTVYRVAWPSLGEAQSEWYPTEREAIDRARGCRHE